MVDSAQGLNGKDAIVVNGDVNRLYVCPASALPAALDLFVRRAIGTSMSQLGASVTTC